MELQQLEVNNLLDLTKKNIINIVSDTVARVTEGDLSAINALVYARKAKELFECLEKEVRPLAESSFHLAKGEKHNLHNVEIVEAETGVKYDYSTCGDAEWDELNSKSETIKEALKERESFLKNVTKAMELVNTETGETYTVHPPVRSGKLGLKLTLK